MDYPVYIFPPLLLFKFLQISILETWYITHWFFIVLSSKITIHMPNNTTKEPSQ